MKTLKMKKLRVHLGNKLAGAQDEGWGAERPRAGKEVSPHVNPQGSDPWPCLLKVHFVRASETQYYRVHPLKTSSSKEARQRHRVSLLFNKQAEEQLAGWPPLFPFPAASPWSCAFHGPWEQKAQTANDETDPGISTVPLCAHTGTHPRPQTHSLTHTQTG